LLQILDTDFSVGIADMDIRDLRTVRAECQEIEAGLSYTRRVAQGRLDIVAAEVARRHEGRPASDIAQIVAELPTILADRVRSPGNGRLPQLMAPAALDVVLAELDEVVSPSQITTIAEVTDEDLVAMSENLSDYEQRVSGQRRRLHDRIDSLQGELIRRYKSGDATVDSLLAKP